VYDFFKVSKHFHDTSSVPAHTKQARDGKDAASLTSPGNNEAAEKRKLVKKKKTKMGKVNKKRRKHEITRKSNM
jgi:hypothetical protein